MFPHQLTNVSNLLASEMNSAFLTVQVIRTVQPIISLKTRTPNSSDYLEDIIRWIWLPIQVTTTVERT